jgi:hypothetical protein
MRIIHKYLHEFNFPFSDFLRKERENILEYYTTVKNSTRDKPLINTPINYYFNDRIKQLIEDYYYITPTIYDIDLNLYIQDNDPSYTSNFHTHIQTSQAISGVFYLDLPKEGGELEFFHEPTIPRENPLRIKPQEDKLYLFPSWIHHKPTSQKDSKPRICINIGYISNTKPMLKNYGISW